MRRWATRSRRIALPLVAGVLLSGCLLGCAPAPPDPPSSTASASGSPAPSVVPAAPSTPRPTSAPTGAPAATPGPSQTVPAAEVPPDDLPLVARAERDGIAVRVELQRNPMPAGEPSWVRTSVTNRGTTPVTWSHGGCATPVDLWAEVPAPFAIGDAPSGAVAEFKRRVMDLDGDAVAPFPSQLRFVPRAWLGAGTFGCADTSFTETIQPGATILDRQWWSGFADAKRGLPAGGMTTLRAEAGHYWRPGEKPRDLADATIPLELPLWITGGLAPDRLSPYEVVDAAGRDPGFAAFLETQDLGSGRDEVLWYDPEADRWEVGVLPWHESDPPRIHGVLVDPVSGDILGVLDREWDERLDGVP